MNHVPRSWENSYFQLHLGTANIQKVPSKDDFSISVAFIYVAIFYLETILAYPTHNVGFHNKSLYDTQNCSTWFFFSIKGFWVLELNIKIKRIL